MTGHDVLPSSFRDPAGFLYKKDNILYRQVNSAYSDNYELLMNSGLYDALVKLRLLIPHEEVGLECAATENAFKVLKPEPVRTISYPHEWCFSQLQDAALTTIRIQRIALSFGMVLKDASAYNIQFHNSTPVFIDTLSFSKYQEGGPWVAYKQFCQHFIAPLALMSHSDIRLGSLFLNYIDGIPLDLASRLLPRSSYLNYSLLSHIHLHARAQSRYSSSTAENKYTAPKISSRAYNALMQGIHGTVKRFSWKLPQTEWGGYYSSTNYQDDSMQHKEVLVKEFLSSLKQSNKNVHDLGANEGHFSRIAANLGFQVISHDIDPVAVENNYQQTKKNKERNLLPLLLDLTNPTPAIGWSLQERMSFIQRIDQEIVLALALVHHLAISNNVPLRLIAKFFHSLAAHLIIEFVPKSDSQVMRLLSSRKDIFEDYQQAGFESAFTDCFTIDKKTAIKGSERTLYLMTRK